MTQDYFANNGEMESVNYSGNCFLRKITLGLWDKVGIPRPLSEKDTKLIARILSNYAKLQRITLKNIEEKETMEEKENERLKENSFWDIHGNYEQEDVDTIIWTEKLANFFEKSGGLMSEEEWSEREKLKESE